MAVQQPERTRQLEINACTPQPKARCTYHECNAVFCISNERAFVFWSVRSAKNDRRAAPLPSETQPTTSPYQPSTYAMVAPFNQRMSTSSTTPQWIMEVQQGLPVMHAVWA